MYLEVAVSASLEAVTRRGCILTVSNIGWKNRKLSLHFITLQAFERLCQNNGNDKILKLSNQNIPKLQFNFHQCSWINCTKVADTA